MFDKQLYVQYEKEKEYLDNLIKEFVELLKRFDHFEAISEIGKNLVAEKNSFENDFVVLNCEIQQIRSDNETLLDEIKNREEHLKMLDKEIQEKTSLIQLLENKITEMKSA